MRWPCLVLLMAACSPEIGPETYYCGPERFCPPELECDDNSFTCVRSFQVEAFSCPEGSELAEPDNQPSEAGSPGQPVCGDLLLSNSPGCIVGDDVDYVLIDNQVSCNGTDPHFEIKLRYPVANVPLLLELLDDQGDILATGEDCTPSENFSGRDHMCLDFTPSAGTSYFVRVRADPDGADCGGDCRHNQYLLDIAYPLS